MHAEASGQLPPLPEMGNSELLASPFTTVQVRQGATWGVVGRIVVMGYRIFTLPLLWRWALRSVQRGEMQPLNAAPSAAISGLGAPRGPSIVVRSLTMPRGRGMLTRDRFGANKYTVENPIAFVFY
jgi:hypothetical protein